MIQTGIFTYILKNFLEQTRTLIRANKSQSQELLIKKLSCLIRQWWFFLNYYPLYSDNASAAFFEKKTREGSRCRKGPLSLSVGSGSRCFRRKRPLLIRSLLAIRRKRVGTFEASLASCYPEEAGELKGSHFPLLPTLAFSPRVAASRFALPFGFLLCKTKAARPRFAYQRGPRCPKSESESESEGKVKTQIRIRIRRGEQREASVGEGQKPRSYVKKTNPKHFKCEHFLEPRYFLNPLLHPFQKMLCIFWKGPFVQCFFPTKGKSIGQRRSSAKKRRFLTNSQKTIFESHVTNLSTKYKGTERAFKLLQKTPKAFFYKEHAVFHTSIDETQSLTNKKGQFDIISMPSPSLFFFCFFSFNPQVNSRKFSRAYAGLTPWGASRKVDVLRLGGFAKVLKKCPLPSDAAFVLFFTFGKKQIRIRIRIRIRRQSKNRRKLPPFGFLKGSHIKNRSPEYKSESESESEGVAHPLPTDSEKRGQQRREEKNSGFFKPFQKMPRVCLLFASRYFILIKKRPKEAAPKSESESEGASLASRYPEEAGSEKRELDPTFAFPPCSRSLLHQDEVAAPSDTLALRLPASYGQREASVLEGAFEASREPKASFDKGPQTIEKTNPSFLFFLRAKQNYTDSIIFKMLWKWTCKRHPKKNKKWLIKQYFFRINGRNWVFATSGSRYPLSPEGAASYGSNATRFLRIARSERSFKSDGFFETARFARPLWSREANVVRSGYPSPSYGSNATRFLRIARSEGKGSRFFIKIKTSRYSLLHQDEVTTQSIIRIRRGEQPLATRDQRDLCSFARFARFAREAPNLNQKGPLLQQDEGASEGKKQPLFWWESFWPFTKKGGCFPIFLDEATWRLPLVLLPLKNLRFLKAFVLFFIFGKKQIRIRIRIRIRRQSKNSKKGGQATAPFCSSIFKTKAQFYLGSFFISKHNKLNWVQLLPIYYFTNYKNLIPVLKEKTRFDFYITLPKHSEITVTHYKKTKKKYAPKQLCEQVNDLLFWSCRASKT